ncbi:MAG: hypothetical protein LBV69_01910 [Bacteroidales bacterium]|jgi:pimeloyl-ACP methyl ester carboxylesterase|nr:hypothetical protein [Bacteroidales bacterium]
MKKFAIILLFIIIPICNGFSQTSNIIINKASHFELILENDTIDFIVLNSNLSEKKPILLYCQSENPIPLFINYNNSEIFMYAGGIINFDYKSIAENYYIVVISKPKISLISEPTEIFNNDTEIINYFKRNNQNSDFLNSESLENNTNRALYVLKFLSSQKWVDNTNLVVVGYSQGAEIATNIAIKNNKVTKLGLLNPIPYGKIGLAIRQIRQEANKKIISWEEADKKISELTEFYSLSLDPIVIKKSLGIVSWGSFSTPLIEEWTKLNIPIFLGYGINDFSAEFCDLAPLYFIRINKNNLTAKRYINMGHNFCNIDTNGNEDINFIHWNEVMADFCQWLQ